MVNGEWIIAQKSGLLPLRLLALLAVYSPKILLYSDQGCRPPYFEVTTKHVRITAKDAMKYRLQSPVSLLGSALCYESRLIFQLIGCAVGRFIFPPRPRLTFDV